MAVRGSSSTLVYYVQRKEFIVYVLVEPGAFEIEQPKAGEPA